MEAVTEVLLELMRDSEGAPSRAAIGEALAMRCESL